MLKSNIAWMKKNVPSDLKVWKGMIQDIDWSQVAAKTKPVSYTHLTLPTT